jgi:hypothetical protein
MISEYSYGYRLKVLGLYFASLIRESDSSLLAFRRFFKFPHRQLRLKHNAMASDHDRTPASDSQPARRLKLTMPVAKLDENYSLGHSAASKDDSKSPDRPSYSPVTPTLPGSPLVHPQSQTRDTRGKPDGMDRQPEPLPLDEERNPDAMAMSAAISILQMQRQQAISDMQKLGKMKAAALDDPEAFLRDLNDGKLTAVPRNGVDVDDDASEEAEDEHQMNGSSNFGQFPAAQNVVRAPPIEWAKYHIVGEPLDKMHEIQRRYPGFKEEMLDAVQKPQPHAIASPYKPFSDKLDDPATPP